MSLFKKIKSLIDKKLLLLMVGFYTVFLIISSSKMVYFKSIGERFNDSTWTYMFFGVYFTDYLLVVFFMSIVLLITKYMVIRNWAWGNMIVVHAVMSILLGIFIFTGLLTIQKLLGLHQIQSVDFKTLLYYYFNVIDLNFLIYFSIVGIAHTYYFINQLKEAEAAQNREKLKMIGVQLNTLQTQINPHFFFNTLNSISTLMVSDVKKAQDTVVNVADLLRTMLDINEVTTITLSKELDILDKYLDIMTTRYPNSLIVEKHIDEGVDNYLVPSLILQPILENAIKHGFSRQTKVLKVWVTVKRTREGNLLLAVENSGNQLPKSFDVTKTKGLGLKNTIDRLKILFDESASFTMGNTKDGVLVQIRIPIMEKENHHIPVMEVVG
jgi:two-component system, LytTR family, sensor kinase